MHLLNDSLNSATNKFTGFLLIWGSKTYKPSLNIPVGQLARLVLLFLTCTVFTQANAQTSQLGKFPTARNDALQQLLVSSMDELNVSSLIEKNLLSVTLVDITDINEPVLAHVNGENSYYAASLPKLAILLATYEEVHLGNLKLDKPAQLSVEAMIRKSSNTAATYLYERVGPARIAEILRSDRYQLYDEENGGGLWVGKPYAKQNAWKRDPLANLSHAANGIQAARFYYLLEREELAHPRYCRAMKSILANSSINHKFVKGMKQHRPNAKIYRKSGTWRNYHSDSALIEREDGRTYIAVALAQANNGEQLLQKIIVRLDQIIDQYHSL